MKKYVFPLLLAFASQSHAAGSGVDFELKGVAVPDALSVFYTQILKKPFRLSPDVVAMPEKISFRLMPEQDARAYLIEYMSDIGVSVKSKNGTDFFYKPPQLVEKKTPQFSYVYRPSYRSPEYLAVQLKTLVDDAARFSQGEGTNSDSLVFYGSRADIRRISDVLPQLDTQVDEVLVSGYVYEVQNNTRDGSGLQLAANLLNTKLNFQIGGNSRGYDNFLKISSGVNVSSGRVIQNG